MCVPFAQLWPPQDEVHPRRAQVVSPQPRAALQEQQAKPYQSALWELTPEPLRSDLMEKVRLPGLGMVVHSCNPSALGG